MPSIDEDLPRRRSRGELLEHIYSQGARRRRRRRMGSVGLSLAALAVVAGAVFTVDLPGSTPQHVATRGQTAPPFPGSTTSLVVLPTTTAPAPPTTRATAGVAGTPVPTTVARPGPGQAPPTPSTTIRPVTTTAADGDNTGADTEPTSTTQPPSTLATSTCINSSDPACGPFHWQPDPGSNAPLVIEVTATARAADPRTFDFAIVYSDADAPVSAECRSVLYGDGEGISSTCAMASCIAAYGAWTPPASKPGREESTVSHTFTKAGTFEVTINAISRNSLCHDPYASSGTKTVSVVVP